MLARGRRSGRLGLSPIAALVDVVDQHREGSSKVAVEFRRGDKHRTAVRHGSRLPQLAALCLLIRWASVQCDPNRPWSSPTY